MKKIILSFAIIFLTSGLTVADSYYDQQYQRRLEADRQYQREYQRRLDADRQYQRKLERETRIEELDKEDQAIQQRLKNSKDHYETQRLQQESFHKQRMKMIENLR